MNVQTSVRYVFAGFATPVRQCLRRNVHTSPVLRARSTPKKHKNIKAEDMGLVRRKSQKVQEDSEIANREKYGVQPINAHNLANPDTLKSYTEEEKAMLRKAYTKEQLASIEAGEAAVDPEDLQHQAILREDQMGLTYFDDLSRIHPVVDKPIRAPEENYDLKQRFKTEDELLEDMADWFEQAPTKPDVADYAEFWQNQRLTVGKEEAERNPRSYLAPTLPVIPSLASKTKVDPVDPATRRLLQQTGFSQKDITGVKIKQVVRRRIANQTRMGKQYKISILSVAGNGRGLLGIGEASSPVKDSLQAVHRSQAAAIRNMQPIHRYESRTIYGDLKGKVSGTEVELMHRTPGRRINPLLAETRPIDTFDRFRPAMSRNHLRDVQMRRDQRFGSPCVSVEEQDEYCQSDAHGSPEPAATRRCRSSKRTKDCRRAACILRREALDVVRIICT